MELFVSALKGQLRPTPKRDRILHVSAALSLAGQMIVLLSFFL
ncbi:MAG: hypothetical protein RBT71_09360 [Flavobacteriales bacterium]|jgi:hypothetical protein|nr:hypothetical protein [Flavobacteriales bacterium]